MGHPLSSLGTLPGEHFPWLIIPVKPLSVTKISRMHVHPLVLPSSHSVNLISHLTIMTSTSAMTCEPIDNDGDDSDKVCANWGKLGSSEATRQAQRSRTCQVLWLAWGGLAEGTHRNQHKKACKQCVAGIKDKKLYSQGLERPEGTSA